MLDQDRDHLRDHLVRARLAGTVGTGVRGTLENCRRLTVGDPVATFGLPDWRHSTFDEVVGAVRALAGGDLGAAQDGEGFIDPALALAGIEEHRDRLRAFVAGGGGRVLVATGHPFALLAHYGAIARALRAAGCEILRPLAQAGEVLRTHDGRPAEIRYLDGVASLCHGAALRHTHRPDAMRSMLVAVDGDIDLVIADHGFAGAALAAGLPTVAIADVNDPALPLAKARGRDAAVLVIDDGRDSHLFEPVTAAVLSGLRGGVPEPTR